MQGLELDLCSGNQSGIEVLSIGPEEKESETIKFSSKVIEILEGKTEKHNLENERLVTVNQLKHVFKRGAKEGASELLIAVSKTIWALARVNMFLNMMREDGLRPVRNEDTLVKENLNGLVMEDYRYSYASLDSSQLDISDNFYPSEEDILKAEQESKEHKFNDYNFTDVEDLYLETEEELRENSSNWLDNIID
jgi:hypothetical protein